MNLETNRPNIIENSSSIFIYYFEMEQVVLSAQMQSPQHYLYSECYYLYQYHSLVLYLNNP